MKTLKKTLSLLLVAVLALAVFTPAICVKADAATMTWYKKGDFDLNGAVQAKDASKILRIAAYLDPQPDATSLKFDVADVDGDKTITSKDARTAARIGAKLETAATLTADQAKAAALKRILDINALKAAPAEGYKKSYGYDKSTLSYGEIAVATGLSVTAETMKAMKDEIEQRQTSTIPHKDLNYYTPYGYYNVSYYTYLPAIGEKDVVFPTGVSAKLVKSVSFTSNSDGTYTIKIVLIDFKITKKAESANVKLLERILPDIHDSEQLKEMGDQLANTMGGGEGDDLISVDLHDSKTFKTSVLGKDKTYYFQNAVTNPTLTYTFNADGYPVSAKYTSKQAITIPATVTLGSGLFAQVATFAMTSYEETDCSYTFTVAPAA